MSVEVGHLPEYIPISEAFKIAIVRFGGMRDIANREMLRALREGKIRNGGEMELLQGDLHYRSIHVSTLDLLRWLDSLTRTH